MQKAFKMIVGYRVLILPGWFCLLAFASCDLNKIDFSAADSDNVQNEAVSDAYFEDATDLTSTTVSVPSETLGGRKIIIADSRFTCADVTLDVGNGSTLLVPKGTITIDFGSAGCADGRGNKRYGKIMITYSGRRFLPGSSLTATFDGYKINGVQVEGTYVLTNTSGSQETDPRFTLSLTSGKLTWPDGTTATRETDHTREWIRTSGGLQDEWYVTGSATGMNRKGNEYSMTVTKKLIYQKVCLANHAKFMAAQGKEELIVGNKKIDIDFGSGSCDEEVTVSINGKSKQVDLNNSN